KVKADSVQVNVAATVHDNLIPAASEAAQVRMCNQRLIRLQPPEKTILPCENQASIGKPVNAEWKERHVKHDLGVAIEIDSNNLVRTPVRKPQTAHVPSR